MIKACAAFEAGGELRTFEYDPGRLGHDEVEIAVEHCGICHSDLNMVDNDWGMTEYPLVPGHEVVGTIASMLEFAARHDIKPVIETYPFARVNDAVKRLRSGKTRYRIVLSG